MNAKVTITKRRIDHQDPEAAGFTDGYWWRVEIPGEDVIESGCATKAEAVALGVGLAEANGYSRDDIELTGA